jgi:hypothetical protein
MTSTPQKFDDNPRAYALIGLPKDWLCNMNPLQGFLWPIERRLVTYYFFALPICHISSRPQPYNSNLLKFRGMLH